MWARPALTAVGGNRGSVGLLKGDGVGFGFDVQVAPRLARPALTVVGADRMSAGLLKGAALCGGDDKAPAGASYVRGIPPAFQGVGLYSALGPNYAPSSTDGAVVGEADGYGGNCLFRSLDQMMSGDRAAGAESTRRARCASARSALVAKCGCDPVAELELHVWWRLIVEELGGDPSDWDILCWAGGDSVGVEAAGCGRRCARLLRAAGPPGQFVPL